MATATTTFSELEKNILRGKGLSDGEIEGLVGVGLGCREDFRTVGDVGTLIELTGLDAEVAARVMAWAVGVPAAAAATGNAPPIVVQAGDAVHCVHCAARQPKDYRSGDLCGSCGKQAEPIL